MAYTDSSSARLDALLAEAGQGIEAMLREIQLSTPNIDHSVLDQVVTYHLRRSQESIIMQYKELDDNHHEVLDNTTILALVQWT